MLRRVVADLEGLRVVATDGDVGRVFDAYVDDRAWAVRYLVVDSSSWLTRRRVLVSPASFGAVDWEARTLAVHMTREQVRHSPEIEPHGPPTRQYEAAYFDYLGYSYYWLGPGVWGAAGMPAALAGATTLPLDPAPASADIASAVDAPGVEDARSGAGRLQSASVVAGVRVEVDGRADGELADLLVDESTWQVPFLEVRADTERLVRLPTSTVIGTYWDERRVTVGRPLDM